MIKTVWHLKYNAIAQSSQTHKNGVDIFAKVAKKMTHNILSSSRTTPSEFMSLISEFVMLIAGMRFSCVKLAVGDFLHLFSDTGRFQIEMITIYWLHAFPNPNLRLIGLSDFVLVHQSSSEYLMATLKFLLCKSDPCPQDWHRLIRANVRYHAKNQQNDEG